MPTRTAGRSAGRCEVRRSRAGNRLDLDVVVVDLRQVPVAILEQLAASVADEELLVRETVTHLHELVDGQLHLVEDLLEWTAKIGGREAAVVPLDEAQRVAAVEPAAADVEAGDIGRAAKPVFQELEVVVDTRLVVVGVLVVDDRAFDRAVVGLESVRLGVERVLVAVPREVVTEEEASRSCAGEILVGGVRVLDEVLALDRLLPDQIRDPQTEQPAELLE